MNVGGTRTVRLVGGRLDGQTREVANVVVRIDPEVYGGTATFDFGGGSIEARLVTTETYERVDEGTFRHVPPRVVDIALAGECRCVTKPELVDGRCVVCRGSRVA